MIEDEPSLLSSEGVQLLGDNAIGPLWHLCFVANSFLFPAYAQFEKSDAITRMEFVVMFTLAHRKELFARDISLITGFPKNNVSRGVKKLLDKGLIRREEDRLDGRRAILSLTREGQSLFNRLLKDYVYRSELILSGLDEVERDQLQHLLLKLSHRILSLPE